MKTSLRTVLALAAFSVTSLVFAQPAPKVYVLDMAKVFDGHYKTEEQTAKLKTDEKKAMDELERLDKDIRSMADKFKEQKDQMDNPALTTEARDRAKTDAQKTMEEIQQKQQEGNNFKLNAQRSFQQRIQNFRQVLVEEIDKIATEIVKRKGGTLLMDKGAILYYDPAYDITDEVMAEINKTRPAGTPAASSTPSTSSSTTTPASSGSPTVTFPGAKK
ncbi:MAG TPA: OmpH family outer membrane protein [Opitutaceae bacterium]|nr:OmpH family outer membrane protein [Opitutaceae bacterium]